MRKFIIIFLILFMPLGSFATVYVDEGFETNTTFDTTPYGQAMTGSGGSECYTGQTSCSYGSNSTHIQSSVKHSGNNAIKITLGEAGGAGPFIQPNYYTSPNWASKTNLFLRFYVYYDAAYRWHSRNKIVVWRIDNCPDLYINCNGDRDGAATCDVGIYFGMSPSDACRSEEPWASDEFYYVARGGANKGWSWLVRPGGWYYMEVQVDTVNKILNFWMQRPGDSSVTNILNNVSLNGCKNMDGRGGEYFGNLEADGWINAVNGPSGGTLYLDDIAISDSYIGPKVPNPQ